MITHAELVAELQAAIDNLYSTQADKIFSPNDLNGARMEFQERLGHRFSALIVACNGNDGASLTVIIHQKRSVPQLDQLAGRLHLCFDSDMVTFEMRGEGQYAHLRATVFTPHYDVMQRGVLPKIRL